MGAGVGARPRVLVSWSSGKDSAWALHVLRSCGDVEVVGLLTTLNEVRERVAMHAVRERLLTTQADVLELPLTKVWIPEPCSNAAYERAMGDALERAKGQGVPSIGRCSTISPPASILAERAASFTPSRTVARCSRVRSPCSLARW